MAGHVEGKTKNEILATLATTAEPGSMVHEQQKAAISAQICESGQHQTQSDTREQHQPDDLQLEMGQQFHQVHFAV